LLRYSRNDELGTALGITVDHTSVEENTFTLRDRDTTKQVRGSEADIIKAIQSLCDGSETWDDVLKRLPLVESKAEDAE
jgi:glycyl-tRNA synthetase